MNYREKQLRQIIKRDYVPLKQHQELTQAHHDLQFAHQQILQDVDYQLQTYTKQENEGLKENLAEWNERYQDLETNLNEQAKLHHEQQTNLKNQAQETQTLLNQKIQDLEQSLFNLAKQKLKGKKEAQAFVEQIEQNWKQDKTQREQEKSQLTEQLSQLNQAYGNLVLANKQLTNQKQNLTQKNEDQKQRILALEADRNDLISQLSQLKTTYLNLRNQTSNLLYPYANIPSLALEDNHLISQAQEVVEKLKASQTELANEKTIREQVENELNQLKNHHPRIKEYYLKSLTFLETKINEFANWLNEDPSRKENLPAWEKILTDPKEELRKFKPKLEANHAEAQEVLNIEIETAKGLIPSDLDQKAEYLKVLKNWTIEQGIFREEEWLHD